MSVVFHVPTIVPLYYSNQLKVHKLKLFGSTLHSSSFFLNCVRPRNFGKYMNTKFQSYPCYVFKSSFMKCGKHSYQPVTEEEISQPENESHHQDNEKLESPWEGAIIYKRNATESHIEYCTTLERLGLGKLSTQASKSRASEMGLRVTKAVKDYPYGTPVQISIDSMKKKKRFRLDGIVKTVITLTCNRCGEPAAKSIFSNFTLLLNEELAAEADIINMGVIYGEDKVKSYDKISEEDDQSLVDLEDQLYFPPEEREIDISKNVRDLVHLEITIDAVCDASCKGMCLNCGMNLNVRTCNCGKEAKNKPSYSPLRNLRRQMAESESA